jgi:hypothetical protein
MADLKDELAALRIEREPETEGGWKWLTWLVMLLVLGGIGAGGSGLVRNGPRPCRRPR